MNQPTLSGPTTKKKGRIPVNQFSLSGPTTKKKGRIPVNQSVRPRHPEILTMDVPLLPALVTLKHKNRQIINIKQMQSVNVVVVVAMYPL